MKILLLLVVASTVTTTGFAVPRSIPNSGLVLDRGTPRATWIQDDIWAVIEYPEGQEVSIELAPTVSVPTAKGTARVVRGANGTEVNLEVSGITGDVETYHAYAIDSLGNATTLGTLSVSNGSSSLRIQTALTKFMLLVSSKDDLVTLSPDMIVVLRSTVPDGFKVVPRTSATDSVSEQPTTPSQPATAEPAAYEAPLLGVDSLKRGVSTQMTARLLEEIHGARVNVSLTPRKNGPTQLKMSVRDLKPAPDGAHYVLWATTPDNTYALVGRVLSGKQTKLDTNVSLADFGLFITIERSDTPSAPTGKMVATFIKQ